MKTLQLSIIVILSVTVIISTNVVFAQTDKNTNLTMVVKMGSIEGTDYQNGTYSQTVNFGGNVGTVQTGQPVIIKIFKNDFLYRTDLIPASDITSDKLFYYKITVTGKFDLDLYRINFIYGNQNVEQILPLAHTGIPPSPLSPLKQFKSGIAAQDVRCKEDLQLVIKSSNGSPACVKPETKQKLIERGWAISDSKPIADSPPVQTKETYLSMTIEEWKDMSKQQVMELYNKNELSFEDLGKFLIKDEMKKELKRQGIENKHEDFMVFPGGMLTSLPPHISYHAVVNSTDGKSYLLGGGTFSNEIESIKIDQLVFHGYVLNPTKVGSGRTLPFEELLAMEPKVTIVPPEGNKARVVPHGLILNLEQNNIANFYNNLDVPIQIEGLDHTSFFSGTTEVWKSNIIQPGESGKVQFNVTGNYDYIARTVEENPDVAGQGTIVAYSNETKNLPFREKIAVAGEFLQHSDIPWTSIDVGNDKGVTLGFSAAIFHMIPDAERYYKARAQQWIPFDVPIIIEVPK